ncbi:hypothetical protein NPIL_541451 [Nephila pilipes]|uniref:Uncharacterized protein n=1 Tax=Nephila pilipes TaxID=299642 RepID=A0A8X6PVP1_NEPPI|nr:hypothetical protein NPIL_541451 [Nephila pilipes]
MKFHEGIEGNEMADKAKKSSSISRDQGFTKNLKGEDEVTTNSAQDASCTKSVINEIGHQPEMKPDAPNPNQSRI